MLVSMVNIFTNKIIATTVNDFACPVSQINYEFEFICMPVVGQVVIWHRK